MNQEQEKCVMVIDEELPLGVAANTAGIMGITLGRHIPEAVGPDVHDKEGRYHLGIITVPVPVLKASKARLREIRGQLYEPCYCGITVVDFSDVAQGCHDYDAFTEKIRAVSPDELNYLGIGIYGSKKLVNRLTGNLPLLR